MKATHVITMTLLAFALASCQQADDLLPNNNDEIILKSAEIAENDLLLEEVAEESATEVEYFSNAREQLWKLARKMGRNNRLLEWKEGMRYPIGQCPGVSVDTSETGYPITITLDYGEGTELNNGRVLSGVVTIVISGPRFTDGTTRTVTYTGFRIDSTGIEGILTDRFSGDNETTREISVTSSLQFTLPDGTTIIREAEKVRTWLEGIETPASFEDDMIQITGFVSSESSNGTSWTKTIINPLIRLGTCRYFVQGSMEFTRDGEVLFLISFGEGECDNLAVMTLDGSDIEIDLSGKRPVAKTNVRKNKP